MHNGNQGFGGTRWRSLMVAAVAMAGTLWTSVAMATITQGDFSVFGFFETREAGRWGEGSSSQDGSATKLVHPTATSTFAVPGQSFGMTGGSFDFNHWDLVEQRNLADVRPDYHMVKNYKLLGPLRHADYQGCGLLRVLPAVVRLVRLDEELWPPAAEYGQNRTMPDRDGGKSCRCRTNTSRMICASIMRS